MAKPTIQQIIDQFHLETLPIEGGLFSQTYCSPEKIDGQALPDRFHGTEHPYGTAILFLLTPDPESFSALHRLPTDEIYHFYLGDPVEMLLLFPDGKSQHVILGQDITAGQKVQFVAPRGVWQGSRLKKGGEYALLGTTMAPGYIQDDFEDGQNLNLDVQYPHEAEFIQQLIHNQIP
jgi:predicted cupin superfamily sugar epimerase